MFCIVVWVYRRRDGAAEGKGGGWGVALGVGGVIGVGWRRMYIIPRMLRMHHAKLPSLCLSPAPYHAIWRRVWVSRSFKKINQKVSNWDKSWVCQPRSQGVWPWKALFAKKITLFTLHVMDSKILQWPYINLPWWLVKIKCLYLITMPIHKRVILSRRMFEVSRNMCQS